MAFKKHTGGWEELSKEFERISNKTGQNKNVRYDPAQTPPPKKVGTTGGWEELQQRMFARDDYNNAVNGLYYRARKEQEAAQAAAVDRLYDVALQDAYEQNRRSSRTNDFSNKSSWSQPLQNSISRTMKDISNNNAWLGETPGISEYYQNKALNEYQEQQNRYQAYLDAQKDWATFEREKADVIDQGTMKYEDSLTRRENLPFNTPAIAPQIDTQIPARIDKGVQLAPVQTKLSREERDAKLNRLKDAEKNLYGSTDYTAAKQEYLDALYDYYASGGDKLLKEQQEDAQSDNRYRASLEGVNLDDMNLLQRGLYSLGNATWGTQKQIAGNIEATAYYMTGLDRFTEEALAEKYSPARQEATEAAWNYVKLLAAQDVGDIDQTDISSAQKRLDAAIDNDELLYNAYTGRVGDGTAASLNDPRNNPFITISTRLKELAERVAAGDTSITKDNIIEQLLWGKSFEEQVKEKAEPIKSSRERFEGLQNSGAEYIRKAQILNPLSDIDPDLGDFATNVYSSALTSAETGWISRVLLGVPIDKLSVLQQQTIDKLAEAGAGKFIKGGTGFIFNRVKDILGMSAFGASAYGASASEARQKLLMAGLEEGEEMRKRIRKYAGTKTAIELATEMLFSSIGPIRNASGESIAQGLGFEGFADVFEKAARSWASSASGAAMLGKWASMLGGGVEEGLEEWIGNALNDILDTGGIVLSKEARWQLDQWALDGAAGFFAAFLGEPVNVIYNNQNLQQLGNDVLSGKKDINYQQLYDIARGMAEENSGRADSMQRLLTDTYNEKTPLVDAFLAVEANGKGATAKNAGILYEAYQQVLENQERGEEAANKALSKAVDGKHLTKADLNRVLQSDTAMNAIAEATGQEITGETTSDRRDSLRTTLEALASEMQASDRAQYENALETIERAANGEFELSTPDRLNLAMQENASMEADQILQNLANEMQNQSRIPQMNLNRNNILPSYQRGQTTGTSQNISSIEANLQRRENTVRQNAAQLRDLVDNMNLGENGRDFMLRNYNGTQNVTEYANAVDEAYELGRAGGRLTPDTAKSEAIPYRLKQMAWLAGTEDRALTTGGTNNGTESEVRLRGIGKRNGSQSTGGQTGRLAQSTGENQRRVVTGEPADRGAAAVTVGTEAVTAADLGVYGGSSNNKAYLVTGNYSDDMKAAEKEAKDRGLEIQFYVKGTGSGYLSDEKGEFPSVIVDGKKIIVRADDPVYSSLYFTIHEATHDDIDKGRINVDEIWNERANGLTGAELDQMAIMYANSFTYIDENGDVQSLYSEKVIKHEIICDAVARMNTVRSNKWKSEASPIYEKVREAAIANREKNAASNETRGPTKEQRFSRAVAAAEKVGIGIDQNTESAEPDDRAQFSRATWNASEYVKDKEKAAKALSDALGVSEDAAKEYIESVNTIARMIGDDAVRLDYNSSPGRSSFVSNSEYGGSFDFSTLCKKRRLLTGTFTEIQKRLPDAILSPLDILRLRQMMKDANLETSCGLCYVEGSRADMGRFTKEFINLYKKYHPGQWAPAYKDIITPDGIEDIRLNHKEVYAEYEKFWNNHGKLRPEDKNLFASQQKPKLYQLRTAYDGEILKYFKNDGTIEAKNRNGGVRMQSFSDFEIVHLIDTMQIIMDMSRVGLAGQAYTKVPDFALALGDTGLKINLSLITKGVDKNGKLIFDDVEGMPHETAFNIRDQYSKNVGTILVTFTDDQLKAAMADDRIDFIIPFHRSQWKKSQYAAMGLPANTKDYTYQQNEKYIHPERHTHKYQDRDVIEKAKNLMPNTYWDFSKTGKENAEAYLEMCAKDDRRPKFYKLLDYYDGRYHLKKDGSTDGYWKLLIDFKMYDNKGVGSPQTAVRPDFNMDEATRMLEEYQGGHEKFPVAHGIVDQFVEEYETKHQKQSFSRATANTLNNDADNTEREKSWEASVNKYTDQVTKWDQQTIGFSFVIGNTTQALLDAGIPDKQIRYDASKVKAELKKHDGLSVPDLIKIPNILHDPIVVVDSKTIDGRKVILGNEYDQHGHLIVLALEINPTSNKGNIIEKVIKIATSQGRSHISSLLDSVIRYVDPDTEKVQEWLNVNRVQFPLHSSILNFNNKISQPTIPVKQDISSADTSLNQIPALHKDSRVEWGKTNIDIGAGAYEAATEYLKEKGVTNLKWDPYNQPEKVNRATLKYLQDGNKADTATNANVLNVIAEKDARLNVVLQAAKSIKPDGKAYFMVYEGDGSGIGRRTSKGWQNNLKTKEYADEIRTYFGNVQVKGKLIVATNPKANLPVASWEVTPGNAVRYSRAVATQSELELAEQNRELRKDLAELRQKLKQRTQSRDYWRGQTKATQGRQLRTEDVNKLAKELIRGNNSEANAEAVAKKLKALGEYILNVTEEQTDTFYEDTRLKAYEVAHDILADAKILREAGGESFYQDFRDRLKSTPIYVAPNVRNDINSDGWNAIRSMMKGIGTVTADPKKGKTIDAVYHDLQAEFGEWLLPDDNLTEAEQFEQILEVVETYRPLYENLNSYEMAEAVEWTANEILTRIIGDEIRETDPTYADRMEKKLSDQKLRSQEALRKVRENRDRREKALKEHYQEVAQAKRERKIDSAARTRLLHIARRLQNKKLDRVTRSLLNQYIGELDLVAKSITKTKLADLNALQSWYDAYANMMGDDFIRDRAIEKKLERLSKKQINDLTQEEVADLTTILLNIENEIRTANKLIDSQVRIDRYAAAEQTIEDVNNSVGKNDLFDKMIASETLTPEREIRKITGYYENDPLYTAAKELSDGQRKMLDYQRRAEAKFRKWTQDRQFTRSISGKHAQEITIEGHNPVTGKNEKVKITPAMRMSLYLHEKNEENMRHIANGGVKIPDIKLYKAGKVTEAYDKGTRIMLSRGQVRDIVSEMTEKEKAFADAASLYFNGMSRDAINETSEKLKGFSIAGVDYYFPIHTDGSFLNKEFDSIKRDGSLEGMGFLKERIEGATTPIMLFDMNTVLTRGISQHSKYYGLAIPVRNFNKLYRVKMMRNQTSMEEAIKRRWGSTATNYIEKMLTDIQNGTGLKRDIWGSILHWTRGRYAGAVLTTNASVAFKQTASYPTAAAVVGWKPLMAALKDVSKVDLEKLAEYTPLLWYRMKGYSTAELGDIGSEGGHIPKALNWIQGMDVATTKMLVKAAMFYVNENNKNLTRNTDAWYKEVAKVYNRIIEETQPNYTMMQRPQILRSDSDLTRALNMFRTQPFQNFNILYDAFGNLAAKTQQYKASGTQDALEQLKAARKNAAKAISSQIASAFWFSLIQFAWDALRGKTGKYEDDDEEMTLASWLKGMGINVLSSAGGMIPTFGGFLVELGEAMTDAVSKALGGNEIFGQKFYGLSENAASAYNDMGKALISMGSKIAGVFGGNEINESTIRSLSDGIMDLAQFAGLPLNNVKNLLQAIARNMFLTTDGQYLGGYKALRVTTDPNKYSGDYYNLLFKAYQNDKTAYEEILNMMLKEDAFTEEKIKNAVETRMKSQQGVNNVGDLDQRWMMPEQQRQYDKGLADISGNKIWLQATDEQQQKVLGQLYDIAIGNANGKKLDEKIKDGASVGIDQAEFLLYQIALQQNDADGNGSYKQSEAEAAIRSMAGLTQEEQAYLFDMQFPKAKNNPFKQAPSRSLSPQEIVDWAVINPYGGAHGRISRPTGVGASPYTREGTGATKNGYGFSQSGRQTEKQKQLEASVGGDFYRAFWDQFNTGDYETQRWGTSVLNDLVNSRQNDFMGTDQYQTAPGHEDAGGRFYASIETLAVLAEESGDSRKSDEYNALLEAMNGMDEEQWAEWSRYLRDLGF